MRSCSGSQPSGNLSLEPGVQATPVAVFLVQTTAGKQRLGLNAPFILGARYNTADSSAHISARQTCLRGYRRGYRPDLYRRELLPGRLFNFFFFALSMHLYLFCVCQPERIPLMHS